MCYFFFKINHTFLNRYALNTSADRQTLSNTFQDTVICQKVVHSLNPMLHMQTRHAFIMLIVSTWNHDACSSRKHLRTKVTPDFHLTYSKMGEIWGRDQNDKNGKLSIYLHKIICCGCVLESPHRGDSNTHPKHMILWRTYDN